MAEKTEIAWCDSTLNPWIGCTKVGPGCDNCYAEREFDHRHHRAKWGAGQERVRTSVRNWNLPLRWDAKPFYECDCGWRGDKIDEHSRACGYPEIGRIKPARRRVFCASLADVFDNEVSPSWRFDLFELIAKTPNIDFLLLTKRIGNVSRMLEDVFERHGRYSALGQPERMRPPEFGEWPWPNVWLGATVVNQAEADRDIQKLLAIPAAVRWVSAEPLLGAIDLGFGDQLGNDDDSSVGCYPCDTGGRRHEHYISETCGRGIDWIVVGGESGANARPMRPHWARSLRDQCEAAGVPFLFKQWGEWAPAKDTAGQRGVIQDLEGYVTMRRVGKNKAGRLLDGKLHHEFPNSPIIQGY